MLIRSPGARFALLAALALVLPGCLGGSDGEGPVPEPRAPEPSPKQYAVLPPEEVWVASSVDGKRIHNAVYRPDTDASVPVFINFSPYWGDTAMAMGDPFARYMVEEYVPRGYAVVLSAVRGTGHSEGCFQVGGDLELQDAYDVVDAFAAAPWSNGYVGAGGKSYDSTTQNGLVAKFPHPALKAMFHVSGITDMYRYSYREGVTYTSGAEFTSRYFLTQGLDEYLGATNGAGAADDEDPESLGRILDDAACAELPEHVGSSVGSAATGMKDAYWQERDWNRFLPESAWNGSIFFVHGLQDWNVKPDHILPWLETVQQKGIPTLAWLHQDEDNLGHVYPMRADWNETMLAWLDWSLKGADNGFEDRLGFEVEGTDGVWRRSAAWPLGEPGRATGSPGSPLQPVGAGSRYTGVLRVDVNATTTMPDAVLTAVVYDVGDGRETWVSEAVRSALYPDSLEEPAPGAGLRHYRLESYPFDAVLAPGHALEVRVGAEPRFALVRPGQLEAVEYVDATVHFLATGVEGELSPQPADTSCWAC